MKLIATEKHRGKKAGTPFTASNQYGKLFIKLGHAVQAPAGAAEEFPPVPKFTEPVPPPLPLLFEDADVSGEDAGADQGSTEAPAEAPEMSELEDFPGDEEIAEPGSEIADLRVQYKALYGKGPFMGWKEDKLREMIAAKPQE